MGRFASFFQAYSGIIILENIGNSIVVILGIGLFFIFFCAVIYKFRQEMAKFSIDRPMMWQTTAHQLNFDYCLEGTLLVNKMAIYKLLKPGSSPSFKACAMGSKDGVKIALGDLMYKESRRGTIAHFTQTICILTFEDARFSHSLLRNEHKFYDYFNKLEGIQDIDFPNDKAFSDAFIVQGTIVGKTKEIFTNEVRKLFLDNIAPELQFEAQGKAIVINYGDAIVPKNLEKFIRFIFALAKAIDQHD